MRPDDLLRPTALESSGGCLLLAAMGGLCRRTWANTKMMRRYHLGLGERQFVIDVQEPCAESFSVQVDGEPYEVTLRGDEDLPDASISPAGQRPAASGQRPAASGCTAGWRHRAGWWGCAWGRGESRSRPHPQVA